MLNVELTHCRAQFSPFRCKHVLIHVFCSILYFHHHLKTMKFVWFQASKSVGLTELKVENKDTHFTQQKKTSQLQYTGAKLLISLKSKPNKSYHYLSTRGAQRQQRVTAGGLHGSGCSKYLSFHAHPYNSQDIIYQQLSAKSNTPPWLDELSSHYCI